MNKLRLWWKFEGKYLHRKTRQGIKNLIRWFPTIWNDADWDDHYIWAIMIKKLEFQAKYIREKGIHVDHIRDAERIETCVRLMKLISEEKYTTEYIDYQHSEIMFIDSESHPGYYEMKSNDIWEKYDEYFKKYPHAYCEVTKTDKYIFKNDTKQTIAMNMGHYLHKKANRILFKMMEEYLQTWWD